jgi:hypothetical protein
MACSHLLRPAFLVRRSTLDPTAPLTAAREEHNFAMARFPQGRRGEGRERVRDSRKERREREKAVGQDKRQKAAAAVTVLAPRDMLKMLDVGLRESKVSPTLARTINAHLSNLLLSGRDRGASKSSQLAAAMVDDLHHIQKKAAQTVRGTLTPAPGAEPRRETAQLPPEIPTRPIRKLFQFAAWRTAFHPAISHGLEQQLPPPAQP